MCHNHGRHMLVRLHQHIYYHAHHQHAHQTINIISMTVVNMCNNTLKST